MSTTTHRAASVSSTHEAPAFLELLTRPGILDPEEATLRRRLIYTFAVFGVLLLAQMWTSMEFRNLGYRSEALGRLIHKLDQERVELEDAVARESRPALLASRAVELGMQKPGQGQLRRLTQLPTPVLPIARAANGAAPTATGAGSAAQAAADVAVPQQATAGTAAVSAQPGAVGAD